MPPKQRAIKNAFNERVARLAKALSSPRRLELLDALSQGPRTVESLANQTEMSMANTSQHLQVLRGTALVGSQKDGLFVSYRVASVQVAEFLRTLRRLAGAVLVDAERNLQRFVESELPLEAFDRDALLTGVQNGEILLLDVRPSEEYRAGHLPGARSMPLEELEQRLVELPATPHIVAYCRGPYCLLAQQAVEILRANGFMATRLAEGVQEWRARGDRVVDGPDSHDGAVSGDS